MNGAVLEYPIAVTDATDKVAACYRFPGEERQHIHTHTHTQTYTQLRQATAEDTFACVINLHALVLGRWPSNCSKGSPFALALHSYRHTYRFISHEYLI